MVLVDRPQPVQEQEVLPRVEQILRQDPLAFGVFCYIVEALKLNEDLLAGLLTDSAPELLEHDFFVLLAPLLLLGPLLPLCLNFVYLLLPGLEFLVSLALKRLPKRDFPHLKLFPGCIDMLASNVTSSLINHVVDSVIQLTLISQWESTQIRVMLQSLKVTQPLNLIYLTTPTDETL